jgi:formylglycine-generating enzyme required for sulfatase activity
MKKHGLLWLALIVLLTGALLGCKGEEGNGDTDYSGWLVPGTDDTTDKEGDENTDDNGGPVQSPEPVKVEFTGLSANGVAGTTTELYLTFNGDIEGLSKDDITIEDTDSTEITIDGETEETEGPVKYTIPVSGITRGGEINVTVSKAGYDINPPSQTVKVSYSMVYVPEESRGFTIGEMTYWSLGNGRFYYGDDDEPEYEVTLNSFYISNHEVTQKEWLDVMGDSLESSWTWKGDDYPAYNISWYDAVEYCNKLSEMTEGLDPVYAINEGTTPPTVTADFTKNGYRLPTEAEWEYVARVMRFDYGRSYSGEGDLSDLAWYKDNSDNSAHPVGKKKANQLGLYDMSGNVWELCWDWYDSYPSYDKYARPSPDPLDNYAGPDSGTNHVIRGGSWYNIDRDARTVNREHDGNANAPAYTIGFRVVRSATPASQ